MKPRLSRSALCDMRTAFRYGTVVTLCIFGVYVLTHRNFSVREDKVEKDIKAHKHTNKNGHAQKSTHQDESNDKVSIVQEFAPGKSRSRVVFYNRVGKCGSRSILYLANRLSAIHNFTFLQSRDFDHDHPSQDEMMNEMKKIAALKSPMFYNRHIHYLDFKKYGYPEPIYINVVRDPIERFSSQYNYVKYGDGEAQVKNPRTDWPDINECVMKNLGICNTNFMYYIGSYFCGFDKVCESPSPDRVELAKKHIDENYVLIGVMEEFESTLLLLQRMLPEYFLGAISNFGRNSNSKTRTKTKKNEILTEESIEKLKNVDMKDEYEVYNHAKRKFEMLKRKYGIYH